MSVPCSVNCVMLCFQHPMSSECLGSSVLRPVWFSVLSLVQACVKDISGQWHLCAVCSVQCEVCSLEFAVFSVHCIVDSVLTSGQWSHCQLMLEIVSMTVSRVFTVSTISIVSLYCTGPETSLFCFFGGDSPSPLFLACPCNHGIIGQKYQQNVILRF